MSEETLHPGFKIAGIVFILFCVSGFQSCQELKYMRSGKTVETTIDRITESTGRRGRLKGYSLWYTFVNENSNKAANGYTTVGINDVDDYTVGQAITIEYIGGTTFKSRIAGTSNYVAPTLFLVMTVLLIGSVVYILRMKPS